MAGRRGGAAVPTLIWAALTTAVVSGAAAAQERGPVPRPSVNLYGMTGLIDMPSAQTQPDAQFVLSYSYFGETQRRNFSFQILPRISGAIRYATIDNWGQRNDRGVYNPNYDLFDRSFDVQFTLWRDGDWRWWTPDVALGFRDFLGTGVYSSEYLVATKTVPTAQAGDFVLTLGVGWGRLSQVNGITNPFCSISDGACDRDNDFGEGGKLSTGTFFRGQNVALFGGAEWRTPLEGLSFKVEYSSDDYKREQRSPAATFVPESQVNVGAEYTIREGITLGAYYMYGSELGVNLALSGNPRRPLVPPDLGTGPLPVNARPADAPRGTGWATNPAAVDQLATALRDILRNEGMELEGFYADPDGRGVEVAIDNLRFQQNPKAIGRTARVLQAGMPASVETFRATAMEDGLRTSTITIDRSDFEAEVDRPDAGARSWQAVEVAGATPSLPEGAWVRPAYPEFVWSVVPAPFLTLLTPGDPIRLGLNIDLETQVIFAPGLSVTATVSQPALNIPNDPGPSETELPPVRSDSPRYYADYAPKLPQLSVDYLFKLNESTYGRASAGLLERMFGGVGGEILWKPVDQSWGLGADLNWVAQRDFDDPFGFDYYSYDVVTGHASVYWDTGYMGLEAQVDAGRYLAGDWGGTFTLSRRFPNGWAVGGYFSLTDVTEEDFGEGSFDKGVFVEVPFRWTVPFETRANNSISLTSVSRDGGAQLQTSNALYPIIRDFDRNRLSRAWSSFWQ
jgi:hypothetical protein